MPDAPRPLADLVERYLAHHAAFVTPKTAQQRRAQLRRALRVLRLSRAADLEDLAALDDRLLDLRRAGASVVHLRRCYQQPLRQLTAWLARHRRHLPQDPLEAWAPFGRLEADGPRPTRRAYRPEEVARALLALDRLHALHGRTHALRPAVIGLLVSGARVGRLLGLRADDLRLDEGRLALGPGRGRKRTGAAALDARTLAEVLAALGARAGAFPDPGAWLFVSPSGQRLRKERLLGWWREAYSLALLETLWPPAEPTSLRLLHLVNRCLLVGHPTVHAGGARLRPETVDRQARLAARVRRLAAQLEPRWSRRLRGVDLHSLRVTHRTWAEARGVPPVVIDKQLGHRAGAGAHDLTRLLAGSWTGRHHYLDVSSALFDPRRAAEAVRDVLDQAEAALRARGESLLVV